MDNLDQIKQNIARLKLTNLSDFKNLNALFEMCLARYEVSGDIQKSLKLCKLIKAKAAELATADVKFFELYNKCLLFEAPWLFDSFLLYMEKNRPVSKKFYLPRRKTLYPVVQDLQDLEDGKLDFLGISLPPRVGKLISDDTPVLTLDGWKNHGDLKVGDYVYDYDGFPVKVTHVFPKRYANKRVWFSDGSFIDCHENHEWIINDRHKGIERIAETNELTDAEYIDPKSGKRRYQYQIPLFQPIIGEIKDLPVKPYTLGAWLGDGRNTNPDICGSKEDYAIVQAIVSDGYEISWRTIHKKTGVEYYGFKNLRKDLQKIGMCHSRKRVEKHIPGIYLSAAIPQRLELLAGLLDTDGTLRRSENRYDFTTSEEALKEDFISLVYTFGWRCSVKEVEPHVSSSGIHGRKKYWIISFNPTYPIPCRLERKQLFAFSKKRRIAITKVEDIDSKPGNCISVQGGIYRVGRRGIPTHNSTLCIFFLAWVMGKRPNSHNAMGGHSGILARGFYGEVLNLMAPPDKSEYTFYEIFPNVKLESKSADEFTVNLDKPDRFATLTCRGIDGTWTGAIDISSDGYLYVDDLVRDRTESLSPTRLNNRYQDYLNVMVDRKNDGSRELMVGTRWNILDPLGRVEKDKKDNPRYRFRKIPALNEKGESNFQYDYGVGFSTKYYLDIKARLDKNEWEAKYQQRPFVREGLLFPEDELRFFNGILPEGGFVRIVSVADVAWGGGDSLSQPIGAEYENGDVYIFDWTFNRGAKEVTIPIVAGKIMGNGIQQTHFEANNGGEMYAKYIDDFLSEKGYKCSITYSKAPSEMAKMAKIIQYSGDIKRKFIFLAPNSVIKKAAENDKPGTKRYYRSAEYDEAMDELTTFVQIGKNEHDDAADSLSQLERFIEGGFTAKGEVFDRRSLGI